MSRAQCFFVIAVAVLLVLVILSLIIYILSLKQQMKRIKNNLARTRQMDNNQQMTISLLDSDLSKLTTEINHNLDYQKKLKLETEKKERQMRQSISDIAHDLRTPLTVVKGNLQMLTQEDLSGRSRAYLDICMEKTEVLKEMVDDFFELSVLESETILPELTKIDLTNFVMQFLLDHEAVIVKSGLTPDLRLPEKSMFVMADSVMLGRICSNLLNNILKYAKNDFHIALTKTQHSVVLSFSNTIEADHVFDADHLFDRTYRADKARHESGAGLGLYIVKLLAQKQKIEVSAKREENELRFDLTFAVCR